MPTNSRPDQSRDVSFGSALAIGLSYALGNAMFVGSAEFVEVAAKEIDLLVVCDRTLRDEP